MSGWNTILSWVEHEKFYNLRACDNYATLPTYACNTKRTAKNNSPFISQFSDIHMVALLVFNL